MGIAQTTKAVPSWKDFGPQIPAVGMLPICFTPTPGLTFSKLDIPGYQTIEPLENQDVLKSIFDDDTNIFWKVDPKCKRQHI